MNYLAATARTIRSVGIAAACVAALAGVTAIAGAEPANAASGFERVGAFSVIGPFPGSSDGNLRHQNKIAVELSTGNILKTDTISDQVRVYAPDANSATEIATLGAGDLLDPYGIAIDQETGSVYISENEIIVKYTSDGASVPAYTKDNTFSSPEVTGALAFDQAGDQLVVADRAGKAIRRYSTAGVPGAAFDGSAGLGSPGPFAGPQDLAIDSTGDILVVDSAGDSAAGAQSSVYRYGGDGTYKATLGPVPTAAAIAVRPATDEVIVSGNQDAVKRDQFPTVTVFAADATTAAVTIHGTANYATVSGLAVDDGIDGRLYVGTDVDRGYGAGGGYGLVSVQVYDPIVQASGLAVVAATAASAVAAFSARANGTLDTLGYKTTYHFEYAIAGTGEWTSTPEQGPTRTSGPVTALLSGLTDGTAYDVRLVASNNTGAATSGTVTLSTVDADPPVVTLDAPSNASADGAVVEGTVDARGYPTTYRFEYSADGGGTWTTASEGAAGSRSSARAVTATLTALSVNGHYLVRLVATNGAGETASGSQTLDTLPVAATAVTGDATTVGDQVATLQATVNAKNLATSYHFEYGTSTSYGSVTPAQSTPAVDADQPVSTDLADLTQGTEYHYRVVASNGVGGQVAGADRTFVTRPTPPTITTQDALKVTISSVTLTARATANGHQGQPRFYLTTDASPDSRTFPAQPIAADSAETTVSVDVSDLAPGTTYRFRAAVTTSGGTAFGQERTFTTGGARDPEIAVLPMKPDPDPFGCQTLDCEPVSNATPRVVATTPIAKVTIGSTTFRGTSATLRVRVPGPGQVSIAGSGITAKAAHPSAAGTVGLRLALTRSGRATLSRRGTVSVRARVTFRPKSGSSRTVTTTLRFSRKGSR